MSKSILQKGKSIVPKGESIIVNKIQQYIAKTEN